MSDLYGSRHDTWYLWTSDFLALPLQIKKLAAVPGSCSCNVTSINNLREMLVNRTRAVQSQYKLSRLHEVFCSDENGLRHVVQCWISIWTQFSHSGHGSSPYLRNLETYPLYKTICNAEVISVQLFPPEVGQLPCTFHGNLTDKLLEGYGKTGLRSRNFLVLHL